MNTKNTQNSSEGKRKHFWIDAPAQFQFVGVILFLVGASLVLAYLSLDHGLEQESIDSDRLFLPVTAARQALLQPFLISGSISLLIAGILGVLWSHRLIGPLMVLTAGIRRVREGNLKEDLRVRDFDMLSGTVRDFNEMQATLKKIVREDREQIEKIESRLKDLAADLRDNPKPGKQALEEIQSLRKEVQKLEEFFKI